MRILVFIFTFSFLTFNTSAQVIPESKRVNWQNTGYDGIIPDPENIINVIDFGAIGDSITNNHTAVTDAIESLQGRKGVVLIPEGNFLIRGTVHLNDSVIIRGISPESTQIIFDNNGETSSCFVVQGNSTGEFIPVDSGYSKGSYSLKLNTSHNFQEDDYLEFRQENGNWDTNPISWSDYSVGQILKVSGTYNKSFDSYNALRIDYSSSLNPEVRKIDPAREVGIECLKISRIDDPGTGNAYNIYFSYAANCWVKGVESNYSAGSHVYLRASTNIEISGCYIHHAFGYDGSGTRGYGVSLNMHTGQCLIENNIFKKLRHAMIAKTGANGNVFGYNYSIEPYRSEPIHDFSGDISLHGHYAFANLFEGNIVQNIITDHYWGPSGPYNTFFRNRAELYGIIFTESDTVQTNTQNIVGNEVTNFDLFYGNYLLYGEEHFEYGNNILNTIIPEGTNNLMDSSYYLLSKPLFWDIFDDWPSLGIPNLLNEYSIPAAFRYSIAPPYVVCGDSGIYTSVNNPESSAKINIWPNPCLGKLNIRLSTDGLTKMTLFTTDGTLKFQKDFTGRKGERKIIYLPGAINRGIVLINIKDKNDTRNYKLLLM